MYAVALRADDGLWLLARIRRWDTGDVYYLMPRADPELNAHASYHSSGITHLRSYEWKRFSTQRQKPDPSFKGTECVFAEAFQPGDVSRCRTPCDASQFDAVFEIPIDNFPPDQHHTLVVDLVAPGAGPSSGPWTQIVMQEHFRDTVPWISVTLWRGLK